MQFQTGLPFPSLNGLRVVVSELAPLRKRKPCDCYARFNPCVRIGQSPPHASGCASELYEDAGGMVLDGVVYMHPRRYAEAFGDE